MPVEFMNAREAMLADISVPDVYYSASYAASAEVIDHGSWECAVAEGGTYVFPYLRRPVSDGAGSYDIVSPYGYASVLAPSAERRIEFVEAFRTASRERGLVAEFVRGHPFDLEDPSRDGYLVDRSRPHPTYTVDLRVGGVDGYWQACEGRHRTAVRKAVRHGIEVLETDRRELSDPCSVFRQLYDATMKRVGSSSRLRLEDDYFRALSSGLDDGVCVLEARKDGQAVAASIFLVWGDRFHYHLSGSTEEGMSLGATNALLDHAVRSLMTPAGRLHLGGGVRAGDGLDRFKRSIGNVATTVHLCETVVNPQRYDELVRAAGTGPTGDYFPAYRA
jgi:serine/alanine adding enzyme